MDIEDKAAILYLGAMIFSGVLMIVGSKNILIAPFPIYAISRCIDLSHLQFSVSKI